MKISNLEKKGSGYSTSEYNLNISPELQEKLSKNMQHNFALYARFISINHAQYTVKVKGRNEVRGKAKKPYRQKGTGSARHGSRKSPIFVGGGVAHGPKGNEKKIKLNKKFKNLVKQQILFSHLKNNSIFIFNDEDKQESKIDILKAYLDSNPSSKLIYLIPDTQEKPEKKNLGKLSNFKNFNVNKFNLTNINLINTNYIIITDRQVVEKYLVTEEK